MKKLVVSVLSVIMLVSLLAGSALANGDDINHAFGFTAMTDGTTRTHANVFYEKQYYNEIIEVRHSVIGNGSSAGYTNLIHAYDEQMNWWLGAKWHAPDMIYHSCTSFEITTDASYTPGGRANTKYQQYLGLTSVRLEGQFRVH